MYDFKLVKTLIFFQNRNLIQHMHIVLLYGWYRSVIWFISFCYMVYIVLLYGLYRSIIWFISFCYMVYIVLLYGLYRSIIWFISFYYMVYIVLLYGVLFYYHHIIKEYRHRNLKNNVLYVYEEVEIMSAINDLYPWGRH